MEDTIIKTALFLGALIGYIAGALLYKRYGWKPEDPSRTDLDFIAVSTALSGFIFMIFGIFLFLGIAVFFLT